MEMLFEIYDELCEKASLGESIRMPQRLKSKAQEMSVCQLKRRASALEKDMDHIPGSDKDRAVQSEIADLAFIAYYIFQQRLHEESRESQDA